MIPAPFIAALSAFDEAALTLLANKGLMMRASRDLDDGKVTVTSFDGDKAQVSADGEIVSMDARGPRAATCTCPALGMCRHKLAATLALQNAPASGDGSTTQDAPNPHATTDFTAEVTAFTPATIAKWAGKAAWRGALEIIAESVTETPSAILVSFAQDKGEVRILSGQGLDGIVSKISPALKKTYHAAAMMAARAHFGIVDVEEVPIEAQQPPDDKGIDPDFLATVCDALTECGNVALNIAPVSLEERLFALAVSSRADALPRLGAMLRALSKLVRARRQRDFSFDPDACLELMADAHALLSALGDRWQHLDSAKQSALKGKARQDYAPIGHLNLVGCGADQWRTTAGARGVTGYFYAPSSDIWYSASVARAAGQDPLFDSANAYRNEAIWHAAALDKLSTRAFALIDASASASGRLSMGNGVQAKLNLETAAPDHGSWPCHFTSWQALQERLEQRLTGGLATTRTVLEPVVLAPGRLSRPTFDDLSQSLSWAIEDCDGAWLSLSLEHDGDRGSAMMTALEKITDGGWGGAIVALASVEGGHYVLRPFALLETDKIFSLGLDALPVPAKPGFSAFAGRFLADLAEKFGRLPKQFVALPKSATQLLLATSWQRLLEMAEIGIAQQREQSVARITDCARRLTDAGLPSLGEALSNVYAQGKPSAVAYFRACYRVRLAQRNLIDLPIVRPVA
jgi:hypothetical protein